MILNHDEIKMPENVKPKIPVYITPDISWSMHGKPIKALNDALKRFLLEIKENHQMRQSIEISLVAFNDQPQIVFESKLAHEIDEMPVLEAEGGTNLQAGITKSIELIEKRKKQYRELGMSYYRPWCLLLTDGAPNTKEGLTELASRIYKDTNSKKYTFLGFGVGEQADMTLIQSLNGYIDGEQMPALTISDSSKFLDFFQWLSKSVSQDNPNDVAEAVKDWEQGFTV